MRDETFPDLKNSDVADYLIHTVLCWYNQIQFVFKKYLNHAPSPEAISSTAFYLKAPNSTFSKRKNVRLKLLKPYVDPNYVKKMSIPVSTKSFYKMDL